MSDDTPLFRRSDSIAQLAKALSLAQGEMKHPVKDKTAVVPMKTGGKYEYKYSDLANVLDAMRAPFAKNGLALIQIPTTASNGTCTVTTVLMHESGEWFEAPMTMPLADDRPQTLGSIVTYLRRYSASPMAGLASEDDDDANVAQHSGGYREKPAADRGKLQEKRAERQAEAAAAKETSEGAKPKSPGTFTGTPEQEKIVAGILEKRGVPAEFWDEIRSKLMGKKSTDLDAVIEAVRKGAMDDQGFQTDLDKTF